MTGINYFNIISIVMLWSQCNGSGMISYIAVQRSLPIPLRAYKGPDSFVFGRLTVPEYTVSTKFHIHVGSTSDCKMEPTLWAFAHERYPYVNFRNATSPSDVHIVPNEIDMLMNGSDNQRMLVIDNPKFGDWFWGVIVNKSYEETVKQTGFGGKKKCNFRAMMSQMSAVVDEPPIVSASGDFELRVNASSTVIHRFQPPPGVLSILLELLSCESNSTAIELKSCPVMAKFSVNEMPGVIKKNSKDVPYTSNGLNVTWEPLRVDDRNFFRLSNLNNDNLRVKLRFRPVKKCALAQHLTDVVSHQTDDCILLPEMNRFIDFMTRFQYYFTYNEDESAMGPWSILKISNNRYITAFRIRNGEDQGGTIKFVLRASPIANSTTEVRVFACLSPTRVYGKADDYCLLRLAASSSPTWSSQLLKSSLYMPYPRVGMLYMVMWRECFMNDKPVACLNASFVKVMATSEPCISGKCGEHGSCALVNSRDVQFGACHCEWGYSGFGCTDNRYAIVLSQELMKLLLLTLSNVFFIPATVLAFRRRYFVQALVYCYTMLSSTFYHLCDSGTPYSACIIDYDVLSFCDFYGAIMSMWVTMVAMAGFARGVAELAYISAALGLVIGVVNDRHSLYSFLIPLLVGFLLLVISWVRQCCIRRRCYPRKKWWLAGCMPGVILAICGIILFAFFETADNYAYTHSLWHIIISLSIVFLLPWTKAPPLCQRSAFLSFTAIRNRASELEGDEFPYEDAERVSMDSNVLPVDSDWIYGQSEYDRLLQS